MIFPDFMGTEAAESGTILLEVESEIFMEGLGFGVSG